MAIRPTDKSISIAAGELAAELDRRLAEAEAAGDLDGADDVVDLAAEVVGEASVELEDWEVETVLAQVTPKYVDGLEDDLDEVEDDLAEGLDGAGLKLTTTEAESVAAAILDVVEDPEAWQPRLDLTQRFSPMMKFDEPMYWTKLTIPTGSSEVYYQNAENYPFHYEFAVKYLPQFKGMTREQFDAATLGEGATQDALLGAVVANVGMSEVGIQLVGNKVYDKAAVLAALEKVKKTLDLPDGAQLFYMPTSKQLEAANGMADELAAAGFPVSGPERWATGDQVYSEGWTVGRLKYVPTDKIEEAYAEGELKPTDVLLTDNVPAEVPYVAGIITLAAATPNSHVAILAQSYDVPYAWPRTSEVQAEIKAMDGKQVLFRAGGYPLMQVSEVGEIREPLRSQLLELKKPDPIQVAPKSPYGQIAVSVDALNNDSVKHVGGKATNYALLRRTLPEVNTPKAMAFTFDLWDQVMAVKVPSTQTPGAEVTLGAEIAHRLAPYRTYPPSDLPGLKATLAGVRELILNAPLPTTLKDQVLKAISDNGFTENRGIRFRSSTNVEDTGTFTGAGLYESYTGWVKPRGDKRTVFEAMLSTLASFYFDNAYLERVRRGVPETDVAMAILATYNYPDKLEKANGVATLTYRAGLGTPTGQMVSQIGDESIANPDPGAPKAEVMDLHFFGGTPSAYIKQASTHPDVRLGETVMAKEDYESFGAMMKEVGDQYLKEHGLQPPLTLDFEYKKMAPTDAGETEDKLVVKQVRPIPSSTDKVPVAMMPGTQDFQVSMGEGGDIFARHALKSKWTVKSDGAWLNGPDANTNVGPLTEVKVEYLDWVKQPDGTLVPERKNFEGRLADFPGASHAFSEEEFSLMHSDSWDGQLGRSTLSLATNKTRNEEQGPAMELDEDGLVYKVDLKNPFPAMWTDWDGREHQVIQQPLADPDIYLIPTPPLQDWVHDRWNFQIDPGEVRLENRPEAVKDAAVLIQPRYQYVWHPRDMIVKTESLGKWQGTTITGLTTTPIKLTDDFSQTMEPQHHNFGEDFIFEPRLDPNVTAEQLAELEDQDIVQIYIEGNGIFVSGKDGVWRKLGNQRREF
jgi:hypothetical protein